MGLHPIVELEIVIYMFLDQTVSMDTEELVFQKM